MALPPGTRLGHYQIVAPLGAGGMGEVYRARDDRLERDVALKILPPGAVSDSAARKRFRKEALALSRLNHPNIATVLDFDSQDGMDFLVMEHVAGEGIAEKVAAGPLGEREIARLGFELAEGIAAAHGQGVIHRDLKPGNLRLMPDGRLKILDFGLAQLLEASAPPESGAADTISASGPGITAGTLPYMAPERLHGETADARSDIWAVGLVLYELATGKRAFPEGDNARLITAILHETPPLATTANRRVSASLGSIIAKCLEKDPENRYQSARELAVDLRRLGAGASLLREARPSRSKSTWVLAGAAGLVGLIVLFVLDFGGVRHRLFGGGRPASIHSLAVLPLENLSRDPDQDYFAEGMTEELISSLGGIAGLRVISRSSVKGLKGTDTPLPEIARHLHVDALIEGAVARVGDRVRVTASLVQANPERELWSDSYVRDLKDMLSLQSDIAGDVARHIRAQLAPAPLHLIKSRQPVDPAAYEAYLRGRSELSGFGSQAGRQGIDLFRKAIEIEPTFAQAWAGLADAHYASSSAFVSPREAMPRVREAAQRALKLDPELSEAHAALGVVASQFDWNWSVAENSYRESIRLNPSYANAHLYYAFMLLETDRRAQAISEVRLAHQLDPLSWSTSFYVAQTYYWAGRVDSAIAQCRTLIASEPNAYLPHVVLASCYQDQGLYSQALIEVKSGVAQSGDSIGLGAIAVTYARAGHRREALETLARYDDFMIRSGGYLSHILSAEVYANLGEKDSAFRFLQAAYEDRDENLGFIRTWTVFRPLRSDPRFDDLLRRLRLIE